MPQQTGRLLLPSDYSYMVAVSRTTTLPLRMSNYIHKHLFPCSFVCMFDLICSRPFRVISPRTRSLEASARQTVTK